MTNQRNAHFINATYGEAAALCMELMEDMHPQQHLLKTRQPKNEKYQSAHAAVRLLNVVHTMNQHPFRQPMTFVLANNVMYRFEDGLKTHEEIAAMNPKVVIRQEQDGLYTETTQNYQ